jgi:hypothetical protein
MMASSSASPEYLQLVQNRKGAMLVADQARARMVEVFGAIADTIPRALE